MATQYDISIIGSRAGGGTLARHRAPSGKRILLLERGDGLPREQQNWDVEEVFVKDGKLGRIHEYFDLGQVVSPGTVRRLYS